jgi:predicted phage terminase large subunit-like protein
MQDANGGQVRAGLAPKALLRACRRDVAVFGWYVFGHQAADHHKTWLRAAMTHPRLLVVAPPESAKSTWLGVILMAWQIGRNPLSTNFFGSVTAAQARDRLAVVAQTIRHNPRFRAVFPNVQPDPVRGWRADTINVWDSGGGDYAAWLDRLSREGEPKDATLYAAGVSGQGVIGRRFSGLIVLDDPQDFENARTAAGRERVLRWFRQTLLTRATADARIVVVMTRWARDDLAGELAHTPGWHAITVPAIGPEGQSYWPDHWPLERLKARRREIGAALFRATYQADPAGLSGAVFRAEWFRRWDSVPDFKQVVTFWDLAIGQRETSDYTAGVTAGLTADNDLYILRVRRGHWTFHEQMKRVKRAAEEDRAHYGRLDAVGVEAVQYQIAAAQELLRTTTLPVLPVRPDRDKVARAQGVAARAEAGKVLADRGAAWWPDYVDELIDFPNGAHDDQVDATSGAWALLTRGRPVRMGQNPFYG